MLNELRFYNKLVERSLIRFDHRYFAVGDGLFLIRITQKVLCQIVMTDSCKRYQRWRKASTPKHHLYAQRAIGALRVVDEENGRTSPQVR